MMRIPSVKRGEFLENFMENKKRKSGVNKSRKERLEKKSSVDR